MGFVYMNGDFDLFGLVSLFAPYAYYVHKRSDFLDCLRSARSQLGPVMQRFVPSHRRG